jgi:hypothetical protein
MPVDVWTDAFLDQMRTAGDPVADAAVAKLYATGRVDAVDQLMKTLVQNDGLPSDKLPPAIRDYLTATAALPPIDPAKVAKGEALFARTGPEMLVALGFFSLPASYAARKGVQVLYRTAYLEKRPIRRLFETTQMVIDVLSPGGLSPTGRGVVTSQKVRLMHAAIRHLITHNPARPWDDALGVPINQEDLAGTLMTFACLVLDGLARLNIAVSADDQDAYLHAWLAVGRIMGVREELLPANLDEAHKLTAVIYKRQIAASPEGAALTKALIEGMAELVPLEHWKTIPAGLIHYFLDKDPVTGQDIASMLGVPPVAWDEEIVKFWGDLGSLSQKESGNVLGASIRFIGQHVVEGMLRISRGGARAPFSIPDSLRAEWAK